MQAIIGWLITALVMMFKNRLGLFIASAAVWLGINWATLNLVLEPSLQLLRDYAGQMESGGSGLAGAASAWIGVLNFDKALTMLISAFASRELLMRGRLFLFKRGVGA